MAIVDRYIDETGDKNPDYHAVAAWAHRLGLIEPPPYSIVKQIARITAKASRDDYIEDDDGEPMRRRMNYREKRGDEQLTFWFKMEDATPEKMRLLSTRRRNGTLMDVLQLHRDIKYFNTHHHPGDPLLFDPNFAQPSKSANKKASTRRGHRTSRRPPNPCPNASPTPFWRWPCARPVTMTLHAPCRL